MPPKVDAVVNQPEPFRFEGGNGENGSRWNRWVRGFDLYVTAAGFGNIGSERKKCLFLHAAGDDIQDLLESLIQDEDIPDPYIRCATALKNYFEPQKNKFYERFVFASSLQETSETTDEFVTRLRGLSKHCEFMNQEERILEQFVKGVSSKRLQMKLLEQGNELTLLKATKFGRLEENVQTQSNSLKSIRGHQAEEVNAMKVKCKACFRFHSSGFCFAKGKLCNACGMKDHFKNSALCGSKKEKSKKETGNAYQLGSLAGNPQLDLCPATSDFSCMEKLTSEV